MRYMRCRCGNSAVWTSMGSATCNTCTDCGSTLADGPDTHPDPTPHEWGTAKHGIGDDGQPLTSTVCVACGRSKREIEAVANSQAEPSE